MNLLYLKKRLRINIDNLKNLLKINNDSDLVDFLIGYKIYSFSFHHLTISYLNSEVDNNEDNYTYDGEDLFGEYGGPIKEEQTKLINNINNTISELENTLKMINRLSNPITFNFYNDFTKNILPSKILSDWLLVIIGNKDIRDMDMSVLKINEENRDKIIKSLSNFLITS